jgi:predicted DNA-binding transcriptional regulator YafY
MADEKHDKLFSRLILMMQTLTQDKSVSVTDFTEMFGVDKRTVYRDIKRLSFFPLELRDGIIYLEEDYDMERPNLNGDELLIAELALSSLSGIDAGTDKKLHSIRAKLTNPLYFNPYNIKPEGFENMDKDSELSNKIEDAIRKRNISKVTSNTLTSEVQPYKIVAFDGIWYLLAKDTDDKKIKTYLLSNIQEFRASAKTFSTSYVDVNAILENVHTAWFEDGNSFVVKIKVKQEIAHFFKLKKHLNSQEILKENNDGSLVVAFSVSCDEDVDNLIKSWLPHIEVISPTRFRKRLIGELETYLNSLKVMNSSI